MYNRFMQFNLYIMTTKAKTFKASYRWDQVDKESINECRRHLIGSSFQSEIGTLRLALLCLQSELEEHGTTRLFNQ